MMQYLYRRRQHVERDPVIYRLQSLKRGQRCALGDVEDRKCSRLSYGASHSNCSYQQRCGRSNSHAAAVGDTHRCETASGASCCPLDRLYRAAQLYAEHALSTPTVTNPLYRKGRAGRYAHTLCDPALKNCMLSASYFTILFSSLLTCTG